MPDVVQRVQVLTLLEAGVPVDEIVKKTAVPRSSIYRLRRTARQRGWNPEVSPQIKMEYVEDAHRPGRPKVMTNEHEEEVVALVKATRQGREMTCETIGQQAGVSARTINRLLHERGLSSHGIAMAHANCI